VKYPSLYQVNTRVWLTELSTSIGRRATLDDIPDQDLDRFAKLGFDWIWFLSVWTTGDQSRNVSRTNPTWQHEFQQTLPDLKDQDIGGSGFAIADYHVSANLGGDGALERLRMRLKMRNLKLMLDFVPNHMGPDHPWVTEHPEYFVSGTEGDIASKSENYTRLNLKNGERIIAYGRDPYFSGWPDTVQLDYSNPNTVEAMKQELVRISRQCDGVRCDMAMLVLPDIFERTWGRKAKEFWPEAIKAARQHDADFCLMAEVYWDMEWALQQQGFDYTYDKRLYDRLCDDNVTAIRDHFNAGLDFQDKLARFLENHDEPRAASTFSPEQHKAAAVVTFFSPGLRFFHQGQFEGRRLRISPHLVRAPLEPIQTGILAFYTSLLAALGRPVFRDGEWNQLSCSPAWENNGSNNSFVAFSWSGTDDQKIIVVANYSPHSSQCYLHPSFKDLRNAQWNLKDLLTEACYERDGDDLSMGGLFLDVNSWGYHVFELSKK
jgi:hypothetical protein